MAITKAVVTMMMNLLTSIQIVSPALLLLLTDWEHICSFSFHLPPLPLLGTITDFAMICRSTSVSSTIATTTTATSAITTTTVDDDDPGLTDNFHMHLLPLW